MNHYSSCDRDPNQWIDENGRFLQQAANQLIADYLINEYGRAFEAWKDDISSTIDNIGKSVHNGVNVAGKVIYDGVEGVYYNESWGGGTDKLPLILSNGVSIRSYTNVTWSISKDEKIAPWDTVVECVGTVLLLALAIALIPETGGASLVFCGA